MDGAGPGRTETLVSRKAVQRGALWLLLVTVGVSALLGVAALLSGDFGETQAKILGTTATISGASILAMAAATGMARHTTGPLPIAGILAAILAGTALIAVMWTEPDGDAYGQTVGSLIVVAVWLSHGSLMSAIPLRADYIAVRIFALVSGAFLAFTVDVAIWTEPDNSVIPRIIGIEAIAVAASSIAVPALFRLGGLAAAAGAVAECRYCAGCGARSETAVASGGTIACASCGMRTRIQVLTSATAGGELRGGRDPGLPRPAAPS